MMEREGVHFQTFLVRTLIQHLHPKRSLLAVSKHFPQHFQQNAACNTFVSYTWLFGISNVSILVKLQIVDKGHQMTQSDMKNANHFNKRWCCYGKCSFRCKKYVNLIEKCRQSIRFAILQWYLCWTQWLCKSAAAGPDLLCDVIMSKIWIVVGIEIGRLENEVRSLQKRARCGKICLCVCLKAFFELLLHRYYVLHFSSFDYFISQNNKSCRLKNPYIFIKNVVET